MSSLIIETGGHIIVAELNNSNTTKDFISMLPQLFTMERYDDREYYSVLDFHPSCEGEHIDDFKNGDVTYFPELNTLAIFFAKEGISSQPGLIRMGRVVSDLGTFEKLGDKAKFEMNLL